MYQKIIKHYSLKYNCQISRENLKISVMRIMIIKNEYQLKSKFTCHKKLAKIACLNKVNGFTKSLFCCAFPWKKTNRKNKCAFSWFLDPILRSST